MPVANIHVLKGHPRPALQQVIREFSAAYAEITNSPIDRLQVWITEVDPELYAISGVPASEALADGVRSQLEIPFARILLMEGRPLSQVHAAITSVTEIIARNLGTDPARVRVHVERADPERWGIGGIPASILRKDEIEARKQAG